MITLKSLPFLLWKPTDLKSFGLMVITKVKRSGNIQILPLCHATTLRFQHSFPELVSKAALFCADLSQSCTHADPLLPHDTAQHLQGFTDVPMRLGGTKGGGCETLIGPFGWPDRRMYT